MKSVLFVVQNMNMNGAIKSLLNLFSVINQQKYIINLFIFDNTGIQCSMIPEFVTVVPESKQLQLLETDFKTVVKNGDILTKVVRTVSVLQRKLSCFSKDNDISLLLWKRVSSLPCQYDVAIGWTEGLTHKFIIDKVHAKKKVGWCHIDDNAWPIHTKLQKVLFPKLDVICTVSETCRDILLKKYGLQTEKVKVIRNIMPVSFIKQAAGDTNPYGNYDGVINILTMARFGDLKNPQVAIEAAKNLYESGYRTHWWIFGGGYTEEEYERQLPYLTICKPILNPYPYVKFCDIYVQTSKVGEAWGMAINEAKILGRPVIVSDLQVFREQIEDGKNGLIYENTVESLTAAVEKLIDEKELSDSVTRNLKCGEYSNISALDIFYELVDED